MAQPPIAQDTVTLMFTDIEGSTARWERMPEAMAAALVTHDRILQSAIEDAGGQVFKTVGDAFCALFPDAVSACRASLAAQRGLRSEPWGDVGAIRVRMALHAGPVDRAGGEYVGSTVNRLNRLLSTCHGGQIVLSAAAVALAEPRLPPDTSLRDLGNHRLRDLLQPEHIYQLCAPDLQDDFPALKTLDRNPHNLPPQRFPIVGRAAELDRIAMELRDGTRLVTLTGPEGIGKSRLAIQAAAETMELFPDGAWFVPASDTEDLSEAIRRALALGAGDAHNLATALRPRTLLLVIDDAGTDGSNSERLAALLAAAPNIRSIATSAAPLGIEAEAAISVDPLPWRSTSVPGAGAADPRPPAVELFLQRAQSVHPRFAPDERAFEEIARICELSGGVPAAIEAAASRMRVLTTAQLLSRLIAQARLGTPRGAPSVAR